MRTKLNKNKKKYRPNEYLNLKKQHYNIYALKTLLPYIFETLSVSRKRIMK